MNNTDQRCGTCRYLMTAGRPDDEGRFPCCVPMPPLPSSVSGWECFRWSMGPDEGEGCIGWEQRV